MFEFLANPLVILFNAFAAGIFTKLADASVDNNLKVKEINKVLFGILWGAFASLAVFGSALVAAFYFGILLSWIVRYKLDYYNHGIGGAMVLFSIYLVHPTGFLHYVIMGGTFLLFTTFGLLSRELKLKKKLGWFHEYSVYSFIFLAGLTVYYPQVLLVFFALLTNAVGYHGVKKLTLS